MNSEDNLRRVRYVRHEVHGDPEEIENSLLAFVYDIPYFGPCGIFPPLHLLNEQLASGGSEGGMSPGATWEPFTIPEHEYADLVTAVREVPMDQIRNRARYAHLPYRFDDSFDHHQDYVEWMMASCRKHRAAWQTALERAGFMT